MWIDQNEAKNLLRISLRELKRGIASGEYGFRKSPEGIEEVNLELSEKQQARILDFREKTMLPFAIDALLNSFNLCRDSLEDCRDQILSGDSNLENILIPILANIKLLKFHHSRICKSDLV